MTALTEQRRLITEIIRNTDSHMTAEQIYILAKERMPGIAMGTVYRNLGLMEHDGEIMRIPVPDAPDRFDRNTHQHEHMLCRKCGNLEDVSLPGLLAVMNSMTEMQIDSYELALYGICTNCQKIRSCGGSVNIAATK